MGKAIIFIFLLLGLTVIFKKVAEWFQDTKDINILPASLIEMVAVIIFMFNFGSELKEDIIWTCISILIIVIVTIFNLIKYGIKDGALLSLAELIFSVSAAFLIAFIFLAGTEKRKVRKKKK